MKYTVCAECKKILPDRDVTNLKDVKLADIDKHGYQFGNGKILCLECDIETTQKRD